MSDNEPTYTKPASQQYAERVTSEDYVPDTVLQKGEDPKQSDDGFVNVGAEYRNFANEVDKPRIGEEGAEAAIESEYVAEDADYDKGGPDEGEPDVESDDGELEESGSSTSSTPPSGGSTFPSTPSAPQV